MLTVLFLYINEIYTWAVLLISARTTYGERNFFSSGPEIQALKGQTQCLHFGWNILINTGGFVCWKMLEGAGSFSAVSISLVQSNATRPALQPCCRSWRAFRELQSILMEAILGFCIGVNPCVHPQLCSGVRARRCAILQHQARCLSSTAHGEREICESTKGREVADLYSGSACCTAEVFTWFCNPVTLRLFK